MAMDFMRVVPLDGIEITRSADGRTVESYAAVFDVETEILDQHGHYRETIARTAFDKTLRERGDRVGVFYHHGMTLHGTPSDLGSVPIGSPLSIEADARGLRTVTRYNRSALADSVLEAIRNGDIRGQSFRGRIYQSNPSRVPRRRPGDPLPVVLRTELGLREYGPTPDPAYDTGPMTVRTASDLLDQLDQLDDAERAELVNALTATTRETGPGPATTPGFGAGSEGSPRRPGRLLVARARVRAGLIERGIRRHEA